MEDKLIKKCWKVLLDEIKDISDLKHLVRAECARLLGEIGDARAVPALINMLKKDNWYSKITAVYALGDIGDKRAIPVLREMSTNPLVFDFSGMYNHDMIRVAAAIALLKFDDDSGVKRVNDLLRMKYLHAFLELSAAIRELPDNEKTKTFKDYASFNLLEHFSKTFQSAIHARILKALPFFKTKKSLKMIRKYLKHLSRYVRAQAAESLLKIDPSSKSIGILKGMLKKEKS